MKDVVIDTIDEERKVVGSMRLDGAGKLVNALHEQAEEARKENRLLVVRIIDGETDDDPVVVDCLLSTIETRGRRKKKW